METVLWFLLGVLVGALLTVISVVWVVSRLIREVTTERPLWWPRG